MRFRYLASIGCLAATVFAQENYATWGKSKPITINTSATGANIADTLFGFPLLVRLDSSHAEVFAQAKPGGADLRFRRFPGPPLAYEIDTWDSAARKAEIWVSVDVILPANATQVIHMLWQKADAPAASNGAAVFDSAKGFLAAWHMGGAPGNRANSTPGGRPAVPMTAAAAGTYAGMSVAGVVGAADSLRGGTAAEGSDYFVIDTIRAFGAFNFAAWVYVSTTADRPWFRVFDFGDGEAANNIFLSRSASTSDWMFDVFASQDAFAAGAIVTGQWRHLTAQMGPMNDFSEYPMEIFVDGVSAGTGAASSFAEADRISNFLGKSNWNDSYMSGKLDEVHVSRVARKPGWVKLSFETQKPGASVLTFGATGAPASVAPGARASASSLRVTAEGRGYLFALPAPADAGMRLSVIDVHGRTVWSTVTGRGTSSVAWNGLAADGRPVARGMYFARLAPVSGAQPSAWETRFAHMP